MKGCNAKFLLFIISALILSCGSRNSNIPPVAVIDPELMTFIGQPVRLDGTKSMDPNGDNISFSWEIRSAPSGSNPVLGDAETPFPVFVSDKDGVYRVLLVVSDGTEESKPAEGTIKVFADNYVPIADAGEDMDVYITDEVELNGSMSADPVNRTLNFLWSFESKPDGSIIGIVQNNSPVAKFKPDVPHSSYVVKLVVNNGMFSSVPDLVNVRILNSLPVADAGADALVHPGQEIRLHGIGSDADNDEIKMFSWSIISHPGASETVFLENSAAPNPILYTDPDVLGDYVIELKVYDGYDWSEPDAVVVSMKDLPPDIILETTKTVGHCFRKNASGQWEFFTANTNEPSCPWADRLFLPGVVSDPEGDPFNCQWTVVGKPPEAPMPVFQNEFQCSTYADIKSQAAKILGKYTFRLTATDKYGVSASKDIVVTVTNRPPMSGGCISNCNQSIIYNMCYAKLFFQCYTNQAIQFFLSTAGADPDNDPVFNKFFFSSGKLNCVASNGVWCDNWQTCGSSLILNAQISGQCSNNATWEGTTKVKISFRDPFWAEYNTPNEAASFTVDCSSFLCPL